MSFFENYFNSIKQTTDRNVTDPLTNTGTPYDKYDFSNHSEVISRINKEALPLYQSVRLHYKKFCAWLALNSVPVQPLVVSSYGYRRLKTDSPSGSHYRGLAIDIARPTMLTKKQYVGLFGLYLQKFASNIHVSISLHNVHLHIDLIKGREGASTEVIRKYNSDGSPASYGFDRPVDVEKVFNHYEFELQFKRLYQYMDKSAGGLDILDELTDGSASNIAGGFKDIIVLVIFVIVAIFTLKILSNSGG